MGAGFPPERAGRPAWLNPLDALFVPPGLVKRALDDLHVAHMEQQLDGISGELAPMRNLEPIRRGIEPLEKSMLSVASRSTSSTD
jgi:hypothetical protein